MPKLATNLPSLDDILLEWDNDSQINALKIVDETTRIAHIHAKYLRWRALNFRRLRNLKNELDELTGLKKLFIQGRLSPTDMHEYGVNRGWNKRYGGHKILKGEIDSWLTGDPDILILRDKIDEHENIKIALDEIIGQVNFRGTHIRNIIDNRKFMEGI